MEYNLYLLLLHNIGISQRLLLSIFKNNRDYEYVYNNISYNLLKTYGLKKNQIEYILKQKNILTKNNIKSLLSKRDVRIITYHDDEYPIDLKNIPNPPFLLYVRGKISTGPKISIVGSRKITPYGEKIIEHLTPDISKYFTIVSGGALGCDTKAHSETLKSKATTISVIGTGINKDYPTTNIHLYNEIVKSGGAIISIFPFNEPGNPYNFPIRNEIVAGLSQGVLVVEAKEKSGSLITAKLALDMGKELFTTPGNIFRGTSSGCNLLIQNGEAKLVQNSFDILGEFNINSSTHKKRKKNKIIFTDKIEEAIYNSLLIQSLSIDGLSKVTNYDIQTISFKLSMMEITGLTKKIGGGKYQVR